MEADKTKVKTELSKSLKNTSAMPGYRHLCEGATEDILRTFGGVGINCPLYFCRSDFFVILFCSTDFHDVSLPLPSPPCSRAEDRTGL